MIIECPHCCQQFEVDNQISGQQINCPNCQKAFAAVNSRLFPCPDCCSLISKRAAVCPKCGAPLSTGVKNANFEENNWNDLSAERKIEIYHPSPMNYLWSIILGIFLLPVVVGFVILIIILIEIKCTSYKLTTHRIIVRRGWVAKMQNEIWIKDMRGATLYQNAWQRIIGLGDISIGTAATAEAEIRMVGIPRPQAVVNKINSLRH